MHDSEDRLKLWLRAAQPELFRANAFRILGLPVNAAERQIKKQAEKVKLVEKFGGVEALKTVGPLPLNPAPDIDTIREAIHRLRNPEQRILDEFFWFWPIASDAPDDDQALAALAAGDIKSATEIWYQQADQAGNQGVAGHNLAVLYHATALDLEYIPEVKPLSESLRKLQSAYWREAFTRWRVVLEDNRFWKKLEERIRELDDPRLTPDFASHLRTSLPLVLVSINARLAVQAIEQNENEEAERQRCFMREASFDDEIMDEALRRAAEPVVDQIRTLCEASPQEAEDDPKRADDVTRRLLAQAGALLDVLDRLLPTGHPLCDATRDEVASVALNCLIPFSQATGNWQVARTLLELTRPYARSSGVRERIDNIRAYLLPNPADKRIDNIRAYLLGLAYQPSSV
ncbi:MAG: hypothetical protein H7Y30_05350 [Pyrinomonadaceae bacterium]|nr:hypothetical protein [Pyrinomonadaceae bacterium]